MKTAQPSRRLCDFVPSNASDFIHCRQTETSFLDLHGPRCLALLVLGGRHRVLPMCRARSQSEEYHQTHQTETERNQHERKWPLAFLPGGRLSITTSKRSLAMPTGRTSVGVAVSVSVSLRRPRVNAVAIASRRTTWCPFWLRCACRAVVRCVNGQSVRLAKVRCVNDQPRVSPKVNKCQRAGT